MMGAKISYTCLLQQKKQMVIITGDIIIKTHVRLRHECGICRYFGSLHGENCKDLFEHSLGDVVQLSSR